MTIVLPANRPADRFYRGGAKLSALRHETSIPTHEPEDWIASTTLVAGESAVGLTVLPDGRVLADAVAADPVRWLGPDHVAAFGADTKLLVKLLDAGQRLPVHAHPHVSFAQDHLGHAHGKSEAWYILDGGTVHLGLTRDVDAAELGALVADQRTEDLLALLHPVDVTRGDVVYVPPGMLHAIGESVLIVEVQEPEDLSILLEWEGFAIDGVTAGHLGLGFDTALTAVDRRGRRAGDIEALIHRAGSSSALLPADAAAYFRLEELMPAGAAATTLPSGFAVLVVTEGTLTADGHTLPTGATLLIPHDAGRVVVEGDGAAVIARPPAPVPPG